MTDTARPTPPARRPADQSLEGLAGDAVAGLLKGIGHLIALLARTAGSATRDAWRWFYLAAIVVIVAVDRLAGFHGKVLAGGLAALLLVMLVRHSTAHRGLHAFRAQVASVAGAGLGLAADTPSEPSIKRWGRPDGPVIKVRDVPPTFDASRRGAFQRLFQDRVSAPEVTAWAFAWRLDRNEITISPTTTLPSFVGLDPHRAPVGLALLLGTGRDRDGQPTEVWWDPDVADPHALIGGRTKSGKSVVLRTLVAQALAGGWSIILADPKVVDYRWAEGLAGVTHYGGDDAPMAIDAACAEMDRRQEWMRHHAPRTATDLMTVEGQPFRPCLVIADEVAELVSIGDKDRRKETTALLGSLARRSRFVGMICAFATQRPDVSILPGEVRANLGTRVLTGDGDQHMRQMILETTELSPLPRDPRDPDRAVKGRGRVKVGGSFPREVQFAFVDPVDIIDGMSGQPPPSPPGPSPAGSPPPATPAGLPDPDQPASIQDEGRGAKWFRSAP
jgi:hypothetical protein